MEQRMKPTGNRHAPTRGVAATVVVFAAALLEQAVDGEVIYFAIGAVLFLVGLLAARWPGLFWVPAREPVAPELEEPEALSASSPSALRD